MKKQCFGHMTIFVMKKNYPHNIFYETCLPAYFFSIIQAFEAAMPPENTKPMIQRCVWCFILFNQLEE